MLVEIDRTPPIRWLRLEAGPRNVLRLEVVEALREALGPDEEAPVAVLRGRSDGFSVGLDNATLAKGELERQSLLTAMGELLGELVGGATRLVCLCEGHAVAAGAMLLLAADLRFGVSGRYKIGFTEPGLGMPLPELPALLGRERLDRRRLHALTVLGQTVGPEEAAAVGFLDELVAPEALDARARDAAESLARLTTASYRGSVSAVRGPMVDRVEEIVESQRRRLRALQADA